MITAASVALTATLGVAALLPGPAQASSLVRTPSPIAEAAQAALDAMKGLSVDPLPRGTRAAHHALDHAEITLRRREAAVQVAAALELDPATLDTAWAAVGATRTTVVLTALAQVGVRYRYAESDPADGFDCSGLTEFAWSSVGLDLPHSSAMQLSGGVRRGADQAEAGDLIGYPGHVMLYLGIDQAIIHSPYSGRNVEIQIARRWSGRFTDPTQPVA